MRRLRVTEPSDLVCVGNLTIDEAIVPSGDRHQSVGGDALFAALAARAVGGRVRMLAPLGGDATPQLLAAIRASGTDPATLPRRDLPTVRNVVRYDATGGRSWDLVLGDAHFEEMSVRPADVPADVLAAPAVLVSGMALRAQLELAAWLRSATAATIYFDPQEDYLAGHRDELLGAVRACDVFLPSRVEAVALAGTRDLTMAATTLLRCGPKVVVIKLAEAGVLVSTTERPDPVLVPADAVDAMDSTGAGDAFCGAFAVEHERTGDPEAAAAVGAAVARVAVGAPGIPGRLRAVVNSGVR